MTNSGDTQRRPSCARRLVQFSLRGLLVLVAICSVLLGMAFHRAREQAGAVAAIKSSGGRAFYDYHWNDLYDLDHSASSTVPTWLLDALGVDFFHYVAIVSFDRMETTDDDLAAVAALPEVRVLSVAGRITDDGLKPLKHLRKLQLLAVLSGGITDAGLAELQDLKHLRDLRIFGATDLDFWFSRDPPDPATAAYGVNITNQGLEVLKSLPGLKVLRLDNSKVTRDGARALSDSLPDCIILVNQGREEVFYVEPRDTPPGW